MPHRCVECNNTLESGELDLDTGCPVCGGRKFQYFRVKNDKEKEPGKLTAAGPRQEKARGHGEAPKPVTEDKKPARDRIESVRILEKGRYDINLPILLSRKELVMSKEDGVYVVDLPSALKTPKKKKKLPEDK